MDTKDTAGSQYSLTLIILARVTPRTVKWVMMWNLRNPLLTQNTAFPLITLLKASSLVLYAL